MAKRFPLIDYGVEPILEPHSMHFITDLSVLKSVKILLHFSGKAKNFHFK